MITKEEIEEYLERPIINFQHIKDPITGNDMFAGLVPHIRKDGSQGACSFQFMIDDVEKKNLHLNFKPLVFQRIKYRVQEYMKENEYSEHPEDRSD